MDLEHSTIPIVELASINLMSKGVQGLNLGKITLCSKLYCQL